MLHESALLKPLILVVNDFFVYQPFGIAARVQHESDA